MVEEKVKNVDKTETEKPTLNKKRTKEAISVLKNLNEVFFDNKTKKSLLDDSSESRVYLQVTLKKIPPKKMKSMIKVHLPHSLGTDNIEVCLITGDLEKNNKKAEIEPTVLHYKELLKKHGVGGIAEVVTLRQLRTEYKTYESKRQLSAAYDMFINDKKITGCLPRILGKAFYDNRKFPIQINLDTPNLKDQVKKAVSETVFNLSCRGNSCSSEVARLSMDNGDILENILSCIETLAEKVPGKWANVLGLYIKTAKSEAVPIYMSFENPNELKVKAPRHQEKVKAEELSTVRNAEVKVFKDGRLTIKNLPDSEDESNEEISANEADINVEDSTTDTVRPKNKIKKTKKQDSVNEADIMPISDSKDRDVKPKTKKIKNKVLVNDVSDNEVNMVDSTIEAELKPKDKRKKFKNTLDNEDEVCAEVNVKPKMKKKNASKNLNEAKEKDSTNEASIKPKNKRKKTKELVDNTSDNKAKQETCVNEEDILPKIKRRKTKDSNDEIDCKIIEVKKRKPNKRNNKRAEK